MASGTSRPGRVRLPAMCGIAGIVGSRASAEIARSMAQRLRHRGPDGEGEWVQPGVALAHRRLAILDLSEGGHQPMVFDSQVLSYNGEIYNHAQLRAELPGPWHSTGDTEVLVHLLAKQGSVCLHRLVGMFAFAAWDMREQRLLLVRDRLGIKPLYYQLLPDGIAFASELKALLVLGQPEIDQSAVRDFLFHGYIPAPKTIYRGIAKLPAGHVLTWAAGRVRIDRYWNPSPEIIARSAADTVRELDALLGDVVPAHTLSDVPVGVFLSGGIDSALTAYYLDTPRTYTLGFESVARTETAAARRAAAHGGLTAQQIDSLLTESWREPEYDYLWFYRQYWREDLGPLAQLRWLDLNTDLAEGLLTKVDRTSMAHSLEVRPPLLDHRLVEFMLTVDPRLLVDEQRRRGKLLVRRLMEPRLPPNHLNRPKSGFGLPVHRWLKQHPTLLQDAVRRLMDRGVLQRAVGSEFRRAWYLLILDRWFTAFG